MTDDMGSDGGDIAKGLFDNRKEKKRAEGTGDEEEYGGDAGGGSGAGIFNAEGTGDEEEAGRPSFGERLGQVGERIGDEAGEVAGKVGEAPGQVAGKVGEAPGQVAGKVGEAPGQVEEKVGEAGRKRADAKEQAEREATEEQDRARMDEYRDRNADARGGEEQGGPYEDRAPVETEEGGHAREEEEEHQGTERPEDADRADEEEHGGKKDASVEGEASAGKHDGRTGEDAQTPAEKQEQTREQDPLYQDPKAQDIFRRHADRFLGSAAETAAEGWGDAASKGWDMAQNMVRMCLTHPSAMSSSSRMIGTALAGIRTASDFTDRAAARYGMKVDADPELVKDTLRYKLYQRDRMQGEDIAGNTFRTIADSLARNGGDMQDMSRSQLASHMQDMSAEKDRLLAALAEPDLKPSDRRLITGQIQHLQSYVSGISRQARSLQAQQSETNRYLRQEDLARRRRGYEMLSTGERNPYREVLMTMSPKYGVEVDPATGMPRDRSGLNAAVKTLDGMIDRLAADRSVPEGGRYARLEEYKRLRGAVADRLDRMRREGSRAAVSQYGRYIQDFAEKHPVFATNVGAKMQDIMENGTWTTDGTSIKSILTTLAEMEASADPQEAAVGRMLRISLNHHTVLARLSNGMRNLDEYDFDRLKEDHETYRDSCTALKAELEEMPGSPERDKYIRTLDRMIGWEDRCIASFDDPAARGRDEVALRAAYRGMHEALMGTGGDKGAIAGQGFRDADKRFTDRYRTLMVKYGFAQPANILNAVRAFIESGEGAGGGDGGGQDDTYEEEQKGGNPPPEDESKDDTPPPGDEEEQHEDKGDGTPLPPSGGNRYRYRWEEGQGPKDGEKPTKTQMKTERRFEAVLNSDIYKDADITEEGGAAIQQMFDAGWFRFNGDGSLKDFNNLSTSTLKNLIQKVDESFAKADGGDELTAMQYNAAVDLRKRMQAALEAKKDGGRKGGGRKGPFDPDEAAKDLLNEDGAVNADFFKDPETAKAALLNHGLIGLNSKGRYALNRKNFNKLDGRTQAALQPYIKKLLDAEAGGRKPADTKDREEKEKPTGPNPAVLDRGNVSPDDRSAMHYVLRTALGMNSDEFDMNVANRIEELKNAGTRLNDTTERALTRGEMRSRAYGIMDEAFKGVNLSPAQQKRVYGMAAALADMAFKEMKGGRKPADEKPPEGDGGDEKPGGEKVEPPDDPEAGRTDGEIVNEFKALRTADEKAKWIEDFLQRHESEEKPSIKLMNAVFNAANEGDIGAVLKEKGYIDRLKKLKNPALGGGRQRRGTYRGKGAGGRKKTPASSGGGTVDDVFGYEDVNGLSAEDLGLDAKELEGLRDRCVATADLLKKQDIPEDRMFDLIKDYSSSGYKVPEVHDAYLGALNAYMQRHGISADELKKQYDAWSENKASGEAMGKLKEKMKEWSDRREAREKGEEHTYESLENFSKDISNRLKEALDAGGSPEEAEAVLKELYGMFDARSGGFVNNYLGMQDTYIQNKNAGMPDDSGEQKGIATDMGHIRTAYGNIRDALVNDPELQKRFPPFNKLVNGDFGKRENYGGGETEQDKKKRDAFQEEQRRNVANRTYNDHWNAIKDLGRSPKRLKDAYASLLTMLDNKDATDSTKDEMGSKEIAGRLRAMLLKSGGGVKDYFNNLPDDEKRTFDRLMVKHGQAPVFGTAKVEEKAGDKPVEEKQAERLSDDELYKKMQEEGVLRDDTSRLSFDSDKLDRFAKKHDMKVNDLVKIVNDRVKNGDVLTATGADRMFDPARYVRVDADGVEQGLGASEEGRSMLKALSMYADSHPDADADALKVVERALGSSNPEMELLDEVRGGSYDYVENVLSVPDPRLFTEKNEGSAIGVLCHELGHVADLGPERDSALSREFVDSMEGLIEKGSHQVPPALIEAKAQLERSYDSIRSRYEPEENELATAQTDLSARIKAVKKSGDKVAADRVLSDYAAWQAQFKNLESRKEADMARYRTVKRDWFNFSDIYDALYRGSLIDNPYIETSRGEREWLAGHGQEYYGGRAWVMASEIFANYLSLSICSPRLVEMMGRYSPELIGILDKYKKGIVRGGETE